MWRMRGFHVPGRDARRASLINLRKTIMHALMQIIMYACMHSISCTAMRWPVVLLHTRGGAHAKRDSGWQWRCLP